MQRPLKPQSTGQHRGDPQFPFVIFDWGLGIGDWGRASDKRAANPKSKIEDQKFFTLP